MASGMLVLSCYSLGAKSVLIFGWLVDCLPDWLIGDWMMGDGWGASDDKVWVCVGVGVLWSQSIEGGRGAETGKKLLMRASGLSSKTGTHHLFRLTL